MSQLSDHLRYDAVATMGCPTPYTASLPRSYSVGGGGGSTNSRSDYSELIRTDSVRGNNRSVSQKQGVISSGMIKVSGGSGKVSRSYSVGLGRIEEEKSGDFGEDRAASSDAFRRSRSCAVSATGGVFARTATAGKFRQQL
ncbi:unnamed protein product [Linum tenue]|uniref:Uncharacterized protein n=1 Tax=Linum tenue TaxID=586396 RepID=A0AAV0M0N7_9ROSI|nr:unnamed protein product [Linum tenue]